MENDKNIYRITIEAIGDEAEPKFCGGGPFVTECSGFAIFAKQEIDENRYGMHSLMHRISPQILAKNMLADEDLAEIGKAFSRLKFMELMTRHSEGRAN